MTWTFEETKRGYLNMYRGLTIKGGRDAVNADFYARKIIEGEAEYRAVEKAIGVPWFFVGALHMREAACNFKCCLANGEQIIGTDRKTRLVPAGLGPYATWHESAIDALKIKGLHKIDWTLDVVSRMGFEGERFNGLGYVGKGVNSAYLWAGSNFEQPGKYVADHVWDKDFDDPQIGVMTVIKRLAQVRPDVKAVVDDGAISLPPLDRPMPPDVEPVPRPAPPPPPPPPAPAPTPGKTGAVVVGGAVAGGAVGSALGFDVGKIVFFVIIAAALAVTAYFLLKRKD